MKLFGDLSKLADRTGNFVGRNGRRVGDVATAMQNEPEATATAPPQAPAPSPRTAVPPPPTDVVTASPSSDATELCHACPANGSCPSFCRTCGGGRTIIAPCPLGRR